MKRLTLILVAATALAFGAQAFAQHPSHPGSGGPPPGHGPGSEPGASGSHESATSPHTDMSHASPGNVLSHNTAIASKIKTLTAYGQKLVLVRCLKIIA
jgi:hypothetical protein